MILNSNLPRLSDFGWLSIVIVFGMAGCRGEPSTGSPQPASTTQVSAKSQPLLARLPFEVSAPAAPRAAHDDDWFEDVTQRSGVQWKYRTGCEARYYTLLETVGGGVALIDYDVDGDLDLFFTGGGQMTTPPVTVRGVDCALFRNDGDWSFTDVTESLGLKSTELYTHGAAVNDYDRDGYPDLFVTGYGSCRLLHNRAGLRFEEVILPASSMQKKWFTSAAWGDFDRDGFVDLFAVCYADWHGTEDICVQHQAEGNRRDACAPTQYPGQQSVLLRNQGDGTFEDVSQAAGILPAMRSLGIVTADLDGDGWLDWFVANDVNENQLYWGRDEFPFDEGGVLAGVAFSETGERDGSMGTDIADVDGDGVLDLFIANYAGQDNVLARGIGNRGFINITKSYGLAAPSRRWVKFASLFADFDLDGWLDLFVANGHVLYEASEVPFLQPAQLFRNKDGVRFEEVSAQGGPYFDVPHGGRGAAIGDLDNDGAPDLVIVEQDAPVKILRNRHPAKNWLRLTLVGRTSGRDPVGARVHLQQESRLMVRTICGGGSYLSQSDPRILFALEADHPVDVTVIWPGGEREVFSNLSLRRTHQLAEGAGRRP
ncbi:MAG: hypothetical protein JWP89_39 [Schlesneria sp.]|nr:hypothetical protein [Schlesneria sp.]